MDPYADLGYGSSLTESLPIQVLGEALQAESPPCPCPMCGEIDPRRRLRNAGYCGEVFDPGVLRKAKSKRSNQFSRRRFRTSPGGEIAVAVLCSGIGCIAGIVWMIQGRPKGMKMFGISLLMIVVGYIAMAILGTIGAVLNNGG